MVRTLLTASVILATAAAVPFVKAQAGQFKWPAVQPLQETFTIPDPKRPIIKTFIRDRTGKPLYLFVCRNEYDPSGPRDVLYSGDLDCRLIPAELGEVETNLLVEDHKLAAWYSRGRMFAYQLYGPCANYPEYGRVRNFRLRGMTLTMEFLDVKFEPLLEVQKPVVVQLRSYKLRVTAKNNPSALRDIAEPSGYLDPSVKGRTPPRSCSSVQKGIEWRR